MSNRALHKEAMKLRMAAGVIDAQAARNKERSRIITLLENECCPDWQSGCCDGACRAYKDAITLIKNLKTPPPSHTYQLVETTNQTEGHTL